MPGVLGPASPENNLDRNKETWFRRESLVGPHRAFLQHAHGTLCHAAHNRRNCQPLWTAPWPRSTGIQEWCLSPVEPQHSCSKVSSALLLTPEMGFCFIVVAACGDYKQNPAARTECQESDCPYAGLIVFVCLFCTPFRWTTVKRQSTLVGKRGRRARY